MQDYLRAEMKVGDTVILEHEPENNYDSNALKVLKNDIHVGYVTRRSNKAILAACRDHWIDCKITEVLPEGCYATAVMEQIPSADDDDKKTIQAT